MSEADRERIEVSIKELSAYDFAVPLERVLLAIGKLIQEYGEQGYTDLRLKYYERNDWAEPSFALVGTRLETDREYENRINKAKEDEQARKDILSAKEQTERATLQRLIKKYGVPNE